MPSVAFFNVLSYSSEAKIFAKDSKSISAFWGNPAVLYIVFIKACMSVLEMDESERSNIELEEKINNI